MSDLALRYGNMRWPLPDARTLATRSLAGPCGPCVRVTRLRGSQISLFCFPRAHFGISYLRFWHFIISPLFSAWEFLALILRASRRFPSRSQPASSPPCPLARLPRPHPRFLPITPTSFSARTPSPSFHPYPHCLPSIPVSHSLPSLYRYTLPLSLSALLFPPSPSADVALLSTLPYQPYQPKKQAIAEKKIIYMKKKCEKKRCHLYK